MQTTTPARCVLWTDLNIDGPGVIATRCRVPTRRGSMKKCPFCAEEIQDEAIKCKHCGEFLDGVGRPSQPGTKQPWYFRTSAIVIALCCVGPLALPMLWWRPRTSVLWKVGLTVLVLALTWLSYKATMKSIDTLKECYRLLNA